MEQGFNVSDDQFLQRYIRSILHSYPPRCTRGDRTPLHILGVHASGLLSKAMVIYPAQPNETEGALTATTFIDNTVKMLKK